MAADRRVAAPAACLRTLRRNGRPLRLRPDFRDGDARFLCVREAEPLVHPWLYRGVRVRRALWVSARGLAVWGGRGNLGSSRGAAVARHTLIAIGWRVDLSSPAPTFHGN